MKTLKKLFSVSAIVALLGTLFPMHALAANYSDELQEAYAYALSNGITTMKTIDAADMYGSLTRVAMAKMIANYATTVLGLEPDTSAKCTFTDVTAALDAQYDNGVTKACQLGLMGQNITAFRPNDLVTRAEFGTTLSRALNHDSDDLEAMNAANPYYKDHLNFLKAEGIMNQINNPSMTEVRGYVMLMMMRADEGYTPNEKCSLEEMVACALADDTDACLAACTGNEGEETPANPGSVKVTRAGSIQTQEVPQNVVNKNVGSIKLTAGDNGATINSIVIAHSGLGTAKDVKVQLYMNGVAISSAKSITKSSEEATLKVSPVLEIAAGKSETVDIMVSLGAGAGQNETHSFTVSAVNLANGTSSGTPISLGSIRTTSYLVATADVDLKAGVNKLEAGDTDKKLFSVTYNPTKNSTLNSVSIIAEDDNDAVEDLDLDEAFSNVKAYYDNKEVGKVSIKDDRITISNLNIETSKKITIDLKGDCMYVGKAGEVNLKFDADDDNDPATKDLTTDVLATEVSTNENMRAFVPATPTTLNIAIEGVDMTLKNKTTKAQNVAKGESDVLLMDLELSSATEFDLSSFDIVSTNIADFEEIYLYINGDEYDEITAATTTFDDDLFTVSAKKPLSIQVYADVRDNAGLNNTTQFTMKINKIQNDAGDKITLPVAPAPGSVSKAGHTTTVKGGTLTAKKTQNIPTNKTIKEGEEATLLYFDLKANTDKFNTEGVQITIEDMSAKNGPKNVGELEAYTESLTLEGGSNEVTIDLDTLTDSDTTILFEFEDTIEKDETISFTVKARIKDGEIANISDKIQLSLSAVKDDTASPATPASCTTPAAARDPTDPTTMIAANCTDGFVAASPATDGLNAVSVKGNEYAIASELPEVVLSDRDAEYTTITVNNTSAYDDITVKSITFKVSSIIENLPKDMTSFTFTPKMVDAKNGNVLGTLGTEIVDNGDGTYTYTPAAANVLNNGDFVILELQNTQGVGSNWYTINVSSLTFNYMDDSNDDGDYTTPTTDTTADITETYNKTL